MSTDLPYVHGGEGPIPARIFLVGESWGAEEERSCLPFQGASGQELNRMLHSAGIMRSECWATNVVNARPPFNDLGRWIPARKKDVLPSHEWIGGRFVEPIVAAGVLRLCEEIAEHKPNVIIALGSYALWFLCSRVGILKWRGSQLWTEFPPDLWPARLGPPPRIKVIPTLHPAAVLREMSARSYVIRDLKRAARERETSAYSNVPNWRFQIAEDADKTVGLLKELTARVEVGDIEWIDFDIETAARHIECVAISWSREDALTIPLMSRESIDGYWSLESEAKIVYALYRLLTHPLVKVRWQNGLYDAQYTWRWWGFIPRGGQDTMISHHTAFCGQAKSLAFQASIYADYYVYWKDDGKVADLKVPERQRWVYNGTDCVYTREVGEVSAKVITDLGLQEPEAFQQKMFWPVLKAMIRGVRIDTKRRAEMAVELMQEISDREAFFYRILGHQLNVGSAPQMQKLFYEDLKQKPIYTRAKNGVPGHLTTNDEALREIGLREPLLRPLVKAIQEIRSLRVFKSTFIEATLDLDGRMRTSYNICGTETFRLASSASAFDSGTNLQNVPKGGEDEETGLVLPNVRKIFVPDPGYTMFDKDLSKADLRVVVWEADEPEMKAMLAEGKDPYVEIAREFYRDPTIKKTRDDGSENPKYRTFKSFAHGTHYLGTPFGLASRLGISVHEAERAQKWYLGRNRRIAEWQKEFCQKIASRRYAENIFGYRRYYFGRIDEATFREAIAWVPQSTVALVINKIWLNIDEKFPHIQVQLQVHDSLVGQFPSHMHEQVVRELDEASQIVLPYDDPLVIPSGTKFSKVSWGDC